MDESIREWMYSRLRRVLNLAMGMLCGALRTQVHGFRHGANLQLVILRES
jgi:hypothetical protein